MFRFAVALLLLPVMAFASEVTASEVTEDFSSRLDFVSGTAVWNQALGGVHPSLQVMNFKAGFTPLPVDIGDGSMGSFDPTTYSRFSVNGDLSGQIIRLDLARFPILKVTRFVLAQGYTLEPVGNAPLIIESLSDVTIEGTIQCQGRDGQSSVGATPGAGGTSRCGGADGGNGGLPLGAGLDGGDISSNVTGGRGGNYNVAFSVGGGGGGSWSSTSPPGNGQHFTGAGGSAGQHFSDPEFLNPAGGAGGGGGSGDAATAGGGGGAGGGTVLIRAARDINLGGPPTSVSGFIYVGGGAGGNAGATGGPGGGGGGGSVQVFVGGTINIYNTDVNGASQGNAGIGGTNTAAATRARGGAGRSWYSSVAYNGIGYYTPAEEAPVGPGNVEFNSAAQDVITRVFDLGNTLPAPIGVRFTPTSLDFSFQVAGSNDNFIADDTGWQSSLSAVAQKRYVKLKFVVVTSNVNAPTLLKSSTLDYSLGSETDFKFKAAGCGRVDGGAGPWNALLALLPAVLLLAYRNWLSSLLLKIPRTQTNPRIF